MKLSYDVIVLAGPAAGKFSRWAANLYRNLKQIQMIRTVFLNNNHRLRSGWRILLQLVSFIILLVVVQSFQDAAETRQSLPIYLLSSVLL